MELEVITKFKKMENWSVSIRKYEFLLAIPKYSLIA